MPCINASNFLSREPVQFDLVLVAFSFSFHSFLHARRLLPALFHATMQNHQFLANLTAGYPDVGVLCRPIVILGHIIAGICSS